MYLASRCLEGLQCVGTNTFVLNVFSIFEVLVEEISFGGASIRICYKSLPRANDDTFSECVSII